ncbi:MAG TPA: lipopolysaccharide assembly protein LapA domain-containing protein [Gammaproteobacteria bacterium]|nr:lipopolysaccharide assembly protein LapA domain-containing protein [Gammaproteobacteria bacterium]
MEHTRTVLAVALVAAVLIFVLQNTAVVEVDLLFWTVAMSRSLMLLLVLLIGVALGWIGHAQRRRR